MLTLVADYQQNKPLVLNETFVHGLKSMLCDLSLDKVLRSSVFTFSCGLFSHETNMIVEPNFLCDQEFIAKAITLPGEGEIMDMMEVADPDAVHAVRTFIKKKIASELKEDLLNTVYHLCRVGRRYFRS